MSDKMSIFIVCAIIWLLLSATSCIYISQETTKPRIKSEEKEPTGMVLPAEQITSDRGSGVRTPIPEEIGGPAVELTLRFTPQDSTAYRLITEAEKSVEWEGPLSSEPAGFEGGHTGSRTEMTFTQQIQSIDEKGNAVAKITIEGLKCLAKVRDNTILDFDSSREKDPDSPLRKLIGQSYTVKFSPAGQVLEVIDVNQTQAAASGNSSAHKAALALTSTDAIKQRHTILAMPVAGKNQLRRGDSWSSIKTFSFGMMGSKSYEQIYKLRDIKDIGGRQLAIVEMNAIPSSERAQQLHKEQATGLFSKLFDNIETYTGELKFDLTTGKIEKYIESLRCEWVAVNPLVRQETDKEPAALKMAAIHLYHIEKI